MSELTDLIIQVGDMVGWSFLLWVTFLYELFFPDTLHLKSGTKLKQLLREPSPGVIAALEAVYQRHDELSEEKLLEKLNGDAPRAWQFESVEDIKKHPGGD